MVTDLEDRLKEHNKHMQQGKKTKYGYIELIFQQILLATVMENGINLEGIVDKNLFDVKTIKSYVDRLIEEGRVKRYNKRYRAVLAKDQAILLTYATKISGFLIWGRGDLLPLDFYKKLRIRNGVDLLLYNLSNQMGAFIIYHLIECLNPKNRYLESDRLGSRLSAVWLESVFKAEISTFLDTFMRLFLSKKRIRKGEETPQFFDADDIAGLRMSFRNIYPRLLESFDRVKDQVQKDLSRNDDSLDYDERKCKHRYEYVGRDDSIGYYISKCTKCDKKKKHKQIGK